MARIIFPDSILHQIILVRNISAKHTADAAASVLTPYLTEKGIVLTNDVADLLDVITHADSAALLERQAENNTQLRNLAWNPVMSHLRNYHQFLKSFYKPNFAELGNWGVTISITGKITYPSDFMQRTGLLEDLQIKHDSFAPNPSPLQPYLTANNFSLAADGAKAGTALTHHNTAKQNAIDAETQTQLRDNIMNPINEHLHGIGGFLMNLFTANTKKLGDWGFTIDNSPRAPKLRTCKVLPADQITVKNVTLGGTLTNTGTVPLYVYKGATTTPVAEIVQPNAKLGMIKGYSAITVANQSTLDPGKFTVLVHQ